LTIKNTLAHYKNTILTDNGHEFEDIEALETRPSALASVVDAVARGHRGAGG